MLFFMFSYAIPNFARSGLQALVVCLSVETPILACWSRNASAAIDVFVYLFTQRVVSATVIRTRRPGRITMRACIAWLLFLVVHRVGICVWLWSKLSELLKLFSFRARFEQQWSIPAPSLGWRWSWLVATRRLIRARIKRLIGALARGNQRARTPAVPDVRTVVHDRPILEAGRLFTWAVLWQSQRLDLVESPHDALEGVVGATLGEHQEHFSPETALQPDER
jgi:hypothetical protein